MNRHLRLVAFVALSQLLMGHGGGSAPPPDHKISGPEVNASVSMDPHATKGDADLSAPKPPNDITPTAKWGDITLEYNGLSTKARVFKIPQNFALFRGCDLNMTDLRFVYSKARPNKLAQWIVDEGMLKDLFDEIGIAIDANNVPVITRITKQRCVPAPTDKTLEQDGGDGFNYRRGQLEFEAVIQFMTPK
jgi:hypothetical protein